MNAYCCMFNNKFVKYARAAITTFLRYHPKWHVEAFVVNTLNDKTKTGIFTDKRVHVTHIKKHFRSFKNERHFCNSMRFVEYLKVFDKYNKIIATDIDILFKKELKEIDKQLNKNELCIYYNKDAPPKDRAGASFIAFKTTENVKNFFEYYGKILSTKRLDWWNDQKCLAESYEKHSKNMNVFLFPYEKYCFSSLSDETISQCEVIQPRGNKDSMALSRYRNMVDQVVSDMPQMDVLVLGSGPTGEMIKDFDLSNHYVIGINHSWMLTPFWTHLLYPDDYTGELPTKLNQFQKIVDNTIYMKHNLRYGNLQDRGDAMLFNSLYFSLQFKPKTIGCLGNDLYYPKKGKTHFYGKGNPDPLRHTEEYLIQKFERFRRIAKSQNIEVVNFSGEDRGINPYPQKMFPYQYK